MTQTAAQDPRRFLFLQGPHGPFFSQLGAALRVGGSEVWRVAFNRGDERFWGDRATLIRFTQEASQWPAALERSLDDKRITDVALYGDTRPIHAAAVAAAEARGLRVHVFEEGYLRPYWVTYERGGSNGHSRLMTMDLGQMRAALPATGDRHDEAPAHWGDMRQHMFYGALYHFHVMFRNHRYGHFRSHRAISVAAEFRLHLRRFLLMPLHRAERFLASLRIRAGGFPYHLVLMQLEHDASFLRHIPTFPRCARFLRPA